MALTAHQLYRARIESHLFFGGFQFWSFAISRHRKAKAARLDA
jgi:hypothetical protein